MTCSGYVKDGVVVLDSPDALPDGARVMVAVIQGGAVEPNAIPSLYEQMESFVGILDGLPADLADNHDHYIHGCPKK